LILPYGKFIDLYGAEFSDYATAQVVLDTFVADCYAAWLPVGFDSTELSATTTVNSSEIYFSVSGLVDTINSKTMYIYMPVTTAGGNLTIQWTSTIQNTVSFSIDIVVRSCDGTVIDSTSSEDVSGTFVSSVSAGIYVVEFSSPVDVSVDNSNYLLDTIVSSSSFVPNPVLAEYDDSGTTRRLEACPKMLLPPDTEDTGDWYTDESEAQDSIDENVVSCIAYFVPLGFGASYTSRTASGGSSPSFSADVSGDSSPEVWFSCNATKGQTITVDLSASYTPPEGVDIGTSIGVAIFDYEGNVLGDFNDFDTTTSLTGSFQLIAPYSGRYVFNCSSFFLESEEGAADFSVSGVDSTNQVQALYDVGLDCPARLNCS
jgi:hypothetical protein